MAIEKVHFNKLPAGLKNIYTKAEDLIKKNQNYAYGITLLNDLVKAVPGFSEARTLLRFAEKENAKNVAGFAKFIGTVKSSLAVCKGKMKMKKPLEALNCAEDAIASCYCTQSLYFLYQIALSLEETELAIDALERVYELNPDNEATINELIGLLEDVPGHAARILQLRQKIVSLHPKDLKAQTALRAAAAAATMEMNAEKAAENEKEKVAKRDNGTNAPDLSDLEKGDRIIRSEDDIKEMIRRYEQVVESGGGTVDVLRKLAEFYQKANMHEKAIETFQKLSEKQGVADITVDKAIEKSTVAMANEQLREMEDSGASEEELAEARKSILQYQIDCAKQRIANFPNDLILRYELGTLYFDADMFAEALPEFEESAKNPQRKEIALTYVGRCCAALKQFDRAVQIFKELLEDMSFMNTQKRRTLYYLGVTFEQMNDSASAYDCFKQIYDSNAKYMDVAEKVKKYAPETTAEA
ncbi:MAG: tetratricopeptide repeat protein [Lentisphaeria bacterium]|nr:tetratricopeptide repeat protein [Lentisphaeria bacterium]